MYSSSWCTRGQVHAWSFDAARRMDERMVAVMTAADAFGHAA